MRANEQNPTFTNALIESESLYLRQHAHNPIMWYPWGTEALELAKEKDLPILLSIGYSSCYWCHVMEREVFENISIASYANERFICIKLDREEYPLIDETYMIARQLLTREGGWPNNIFLTPDLKPFYACGTLGAKDTPQRPSFQRLLEWIHAQWNTEREAMEQQGNEIYRLTKNFLKLKQNSDGENFPLSSLVHALTDQLHGVYDDVFGGFLKEPKFPHETYLSYLLYAGEALDHKPAVDIAIDSMLKMASGGIYDQVGCGFHRYAVDKSWMVPHFEKMLYNQALCASAYTQAAKLTENPFLEDIAKGTLDFTSGPMKSELGPFYAAIDAETDGVEGAYYAWTAEEILETLDEKEAAFFQRYYGLADIPHFPGHKKPTGQTIILKTSLWEAAKADNLPYVELAALAGQILNKLLNQRNQRKAPLLDDKIITSWNGLMIKAYAEASKQFDSERYAKLAADAGKYFYERATERNMALHHTYYEAKPMTAPSLEDYAYLAAGIIAIAEHTEDTSVDWMQFAGQLLTRATSMFFDEEIASYRLNMQDPTSGIYIYHATDSALPSAVGVLLNAYLSYYELNKAPEILEHCKVIRDTYQPTINIAGLLEHCELMKGFMRLAKLEGNENFVQEAQRLLYQHTETYEVVKVSASMPPDAKVDNDTPLDITIDLDILDGWHIDAIGGGNTTTSISVTGDNVAAIEQMDLPEASTIESSDGHKKLIYQSKNSIGVRLKCKNTQDRAPINITVKYQPCDNKQCYPAQERKHFL